MGRRDDHLIDQASDVPSIMSFHDFLQNSLQKSFQFIFLFFHKFTRIEIKSFECHKSIRIIKEMMLGTSDTWSQLGRNQDACCFVQKTLSISSAKQEIGDKNLLS